MLNNSFHMIHNSNELYILYNILYTINFHRKDFDFSFRILYISSSYEYYSPYNNLHIIYSYSLLISIFKHMLNTNLLWAQQAVATKIISMIVGSFQCFSRKGIVGIIFTMKILVCRVPSIFDLYLYT